MLSSVVCGVIFFVPPTATVGALLGDVISSRAAYLCLCCPAAVCALSLRVSLEPRRASLFL